MSTLRERNAERLRKSIAGEKIDAHAVFNFYTFPFYHEVTKVNLKDYFHDYKLMFDTQLKVLEMLDGCGNLMPDVGSVAEASALGGKVVFDDHGFISVHDSGEIQTYEDVINKLKPGDPYGDNYMRVALEQLEYMVKHCPKGYKVNPHIIMGPFTVGAQLRGIGDFCADTIDEPELVEALLDVVIETQIRFLKAQEKILGSLHHVLVCDDLSAFLSRTAYNEIILPSYEKLFAQFPNTQRWLHNDSTARHVAPDISKGGMIAWQYHPEITPQDAIKLTENKVTLLGGINPVKFANLSLEEAIEECNRVIDSFEGNSRCVLAAGGSINQVPIENILAMFSVADSRKI
jgi:uroporphyrinogen-III decarboxylase